MPRQHIVQQGECLVSIARQYGLANWRTLYEHPDNETLRRNRPNPNVLFPGDVVIVPDPKPKTVNRVTGRTHTFQVTLPRKELRLTLRDVRDKPFENAHVELEVDGRIWLPPEGQEAWTTDGEGLLKVPVPVGARSVVLAIGDFKVRLRLSHLNPLRDIPEGNLSGVQARLRNLGYDGGTGEGRMGPSTRAALALFQADQGLEVTGKPDDATLRKLEELHTS